MDSETTNSSPSLTAGFREADKTLIGGAFSLTLASLLSHAMNYAAHIGLGRFFAPAVYGYFGIIASTFSILEVILRWGLSKAVSFHIAKDKGTAKDVLRKVLGLQTVYTLAWFVLFYSSADRLALMFGDPGLSAYLRTAAFFILTFAFIPVYSAYCAI